MYDSQKDEIINISDARRVRGWSKNILIKIINKNLGILNFIKYIIFLHILKGKRSAILNSWDLWFYCCYWSF